MNNIVRLKDIYGDDIEISIDSQTKSIEISLGPGQAVSLDPEDARYFAYELRRLANSLKSKETNV